MADLTLGEQQRLFTHLLAQFLCWASDRGYEVSLGEAWRPPETAALYAQQGRGIANSLHCQRLAVDLNIFRGEVLLTTADELRPLGLQWQTYDSRCAWGGTFTKPDCDHFSMEWEGVR